MAVAVDPKALQKVLRSEAGRNAILKLDIAGNGRDQRDSEKLAGRSDQRDTSCTRTSTASRWTLRFA